MSVCYGLKEEKKISPLTQFPSMKPPQIGRNPKLVTWAKFIRGLLKASFQAVS